MDVALDFAAAFAVAAFFTWGLAIIAERLTLSDDGSDAPQRKLQRRAVPLVGGAAIAVVLFTWQRWSAPGCLKPWFALPRELENVREGFGAAALAGAFAVGLVDDLARRGLPPLVKLAVHAVLAWLCARHAAELDPGAGHARIGVTFAVALLALQACNTFDNADGALTALIAFAVWSVTPVIAAPLLAFLPFNLWLRRRAPDGSSTPRAYLGDSGSHLLGVLVALLPSTWPVLVLPLLDLARLSVVRWRHGSKPWIGDRRHLAHRLQARGLRPTAVVAVLLVIAAPAVLAGVIAGSGAWVLPTGVALTLAFFVAALRATPDIP